MSARRIAASDRREWARRDETRPNKPNPMIPSAATGCKMNRIVTNAKLQSIRA